jgi:hypothetical protein
VQFLHPYALFGLLAISIPVIIHLFNFRRYKKLYFTNLKFLRNLKNETQKQQKLRHLLVLISRILAITFIVLAFSRPYIPGPGGEQQASVRNIDIYIDNSMSMQSAMNGTSLLEIAKSKAREIIEAYGTSDRFRILTNDFEGKHQRYYNRDEILRLISEVEISSMYRELPKVYDRMALAEYEDEDARRHQYYVSDFQRSSYAGGISEADSAKLLFYIPLLDESPGNVYIDSCWFSVPYHHIGQQQSVYARITNASSVDLEVIPVRLYVDGVQAAIGSVDIPAGGSSEISLPINNRTAGWHTAEISIEDHPITWDDNFFLSWTVLESIPVMLVSDQDAAFYFSGILGEDSIFRYDYSGVNSLNYSLFSQNNLIILHHVPQLSSGLIRELQEFVGSGGSLFIVPPENTDLASYNRLLSAVEIGQLTAFDTTALKVTGLDATHAFFRDVFEDIPENLDLPVVNGHFPLISDRTTYREVILDLQNGDPYLLFSNHRKGKAYLLTSPLGDQYGNLARHALWVPVMYRMALTSRGEDKAYYTIGKDELVETEMDAIPGEQPYRIRSKGQDYSFIPAYNRSGEYVDLMMFGMLSAAGHYEFGSDEEFIMGFSFNFDRLESQPDVFNAAELRETISAEGIKNIYVVDSAGEQGDMDIVQMSQGISLWKLCIWLALFFILLEILLLRLFRK